VVFEQVSMRYYPSVEAIEVGSGLHTATTQVTSGI
jgi:hypothetical protein